MNEIAELRCLVCHKVDESVVDSEIIRNNYVCKNCDSGKIKKIRVELKCERCCGLFYTKLLIDDIQNYDNWVCPICSSSGNKVNKVNKSIGPAVGCTWCKHKFGVCTHPDVKCSLTNNYVQFNGSGLLYTDKKDCTILSIDKVYKSRKDIHAFSYTLLYKTSYLLSVKNVVLIKQRVGSRKNFQTNVSVYAYENKSGKFVSFFNQSFERGKNWVVVSRDVILKNYPNLIVK